MAQSGGTVARTQPDKAKRAVGFVLQGYGTAIGGMAATALIGGLVEALFLITVTQAAFAISKGQSEIAIVSGRHLSVGPTLGVAMALVALRMLLAGCSNWLTARVSTRVVAEVRHRVSRAFLESSWEVQQAQRGGSLQELLTTHSAQTSNLMNAIAQGVVAIANLAGLLAMALVVDAAGALVLVLSVTILGLLLRPLRGIVRRRARTGTEANMEFAVGVNEVSELGFELHIFHVHAKAQARVADAVERVRKAGEKFQFAAGLSTPIYSGLAYLGLLGALAALAASNTTSLASLGATMLVMLRSLSYGQAVQGAYITASAAIPPIEELQRYLNVFEAGCPLDGGKPVDRVGTIAMENVSFA
jgi:ATP-binding cassette subfamily B protein